MLADSHTQWLRECENKAYYKTLPHQCSVANAASRMHEHAARHSLALCRQLGALSYIAGERGLRNRSFAALHGCDPCDSSDAFAGCRPGIQGTACAIGSLRAALYIFQAMCLLQRRQLVGQ